MELSGSAAAPTANQTRNGSPKSLIGTKPRGLIDLGPGVPQQEFVSDVAGQWVTIGVE